MGADAEKGSYRTPAGRKTWEFIIFGVCSVLSVGIGCVVGWNSPSIVKLLSDDSPIKVTPPDVSTLVATMTVGHMVAPPLNTFLADQIGRKYTMLLASSPLVVSWGLIIIATSVWELYIARFMAGLSLGLFVCIGPMYIGEMSSPQYRGIAGSLTSFAYNMGILATFIVAPYLSISLMAGIYLAVTVGFIVLFWFMPESPYFLAMRNRTEEAEEVLEKLRGKNDVSEEMATIVNSLVSKGKTVTKSGSLRDVLCVPGNFRAFAIIALFSVTHHFGGFFTILTYGQLIFKATNSSTSDYTVNVLLGVMQLVSSLITACLVERVGRRPLILNSGIVAALCNLVIGFFFLAKDYLNMDVSNFSWAPFAASMVMVFAFNCGLMCLQIIMMSEIFATEVKAISTCLVGIVSGCIATLGSKLYIWIAITMNYGHCPPFLAFGVILFILTLTIYTLSPETKGKTFAEIQKDLHG